MRTLFLGSIIPLCLCFPAAAQTLNLRPGLWENTYSTQSAGAPAIPAEVLSKMTPEMRARMEAAMKNRSAPRTSKSCITKDDLNKPLDFDPGKGDGSCTKTILRSSTSSQEIRVDCAKGAQKSTGVVRITVVNPESWSSTMDLTISEPRPITAHTTSSGKWLSSDCGDVKPRSAK